MANGLKEVAFGDDEKGKAKQFTDIESLGQILYNIFVMRPGSLPSLPNVGIDIRQYMYRLEGSIDVDSLKGDIIKSCTELLTFIEVSDIEIQEVDYQNEKVLLIIMTVNLEDITHAMVSAFRTSNNGLLYSFRAETIKVAS